MESYQKRWHVFSAVLFLFCCLVFSGFFSRKCVFVVLVLVSCVGKAFISSSSLIILPLSTTPVSTVREREKSERKKGKREREVVVG